VVRWDAVHRHAFAVVGCRRLSQGSPKLKPIGPPAPDILLPLGRSSTTRVCTPALVLPRDPSHTSSSVDHSAPPQVPPYCIPDTLAFIFLVSVNTRLASCSSILPMSCVSFHVFPPRHPLLQPGTRMPQTTHGARSSLITTALRLRETVSHASRAPLYTNSSYPGQRQHRGQQPGQPSHPSLFLSAPCASLCSRPYLELSHTLQDVAAGSCLAPCLNTGAKLRGSAAQCSQLCDSS
jgi:hypothetical protein